MCILICNTNSHSTIHYYNGSLTISANLILHAMLCFVNNKLHTTYRNFLITYYLCIDTFHYDGKLLHPLTYLNIYLYAQTLIKLINSLC